MRARLPLAVLVTVLVFAALPALAAASPLPPSPAANPAVSTPTPQLDGLAAVLAPAPLPDALSTLPFLASSSSGPRPVGGAICFQCQPPFHQCLVNNRCSCCL